MTLKAPFNFVEYSDKVITPEWHNQISHDNPLPNGVSGQFTMEIEAISPIFVNRIKNDNNVCDSYKDDKGKYFIPGSSIKGMIRNVLEIMTFSKLKNKVQNRKFYYRDLRNDAYTNFLRNNGPIYCGWLKFNKNENKYYIMECGLPNRISHEELDGFLQVNGQNGFQNTYSVKNFKYDDYFKSAQHKYELIKKLYNSTDTYITYKKNNEYYKIVFTGQPGARKYNTNKRKYEGKHKEFLFKINENEGTPVDSEIINEFKQAYNEEDENKRSHDWKKYRVDLKEGKDIPVFFIKDDANNIKHIGLSYMFKIPYEYDIHKGIHQNKDQDIDFSEAIFGYTNGDKALKGRVHFSHAFSNNEVSEEEELALTLLSPKASYYPLYLKQDSSKPNYDTYNSNPFSIKGWKRYPIKSKIIPNITGNQNAKINTKLKPLPIGTSFSCTVNYHNLHPVELGALLSAITFHNSEGCYHSIGMGKPYGYGKVQLTISNFSFDIKQPMGDFEKYMNKALVIDKWIDSKQVGDLIKLSYQDLKNDDDNYMPLNVDGISYTYFKKDKKKQSFEINRAKFQPVSLINDETQTYQDNEFQKFEESKNKLNQILTNKIKAKEIAEQEEKARIEKEKKDKEIAVQEEKAKNEREKRVEARRLEAQHDDTFNIPNKIRDFTQLKRKINEWLGNYYKINSNRVERDITAPQIPKEKLDSFTNRLVQVCNQNQRLKNEILNSYENRIKNVLERWMGQENTNQFYQTITL